MRPDGEKACSDLMFVSVSFDRLRIASALLTISKGKPRSIRD